jgi:D-sedoheptulose 7-phosphate isomerase
MMNWYRNVEKIITILQSLLARNEEGQEIVPDIAFAHWKYLTLKIRDGGKTVYLIGNGASASMASHIAADLAKNVHVHTEVFSDLSLITAIANDLGYKEVFAEPLRRRMIKGDMLVAISSSGQSSNILRAVRQARSLGGYVITLSAMRPDNSLLSQGMINFYLPASTYGMAETCHAALLHYWIDQMTVKTVRSKYARKNLSAMPSSESTNVKGFTNRGNIHGLRGHKGA